MHLKKTYKFSKVTLVVIFVTLFVFLLGLKIIVAFQNADFVDMNARNSLEVSNVIRAKKGNFSFIVLGNVMNSIATFREEMLPEIEASNADFVVFAGNFLLDGRNDKYAALNRMLLPLKKPALFVLGDTDSQDDINIVNFFRHIGSPYFFLAASNTLLIFMDTTGYTRESIQLEWFRELIQNFEEKPQKIILSNRSFVQKGVLPKSIENSYIMSDSYIAQLLDLISSQHVTAAVSSSYTNPEIITKHGTTFIASGGGGGVINPNNTTSPFYFTKLTVQDGKISAENVFPDKPIDSRGMTILDWIWNKIFSWIYVSFLNTTLILLLIFFIIYYFYNRLIMRIDYYPDFDVLPKKDYPLSIAMFTNNYLPFIGGVPLSIVRLKKGLEAKGHKVYIFAPSYKGNEIKDEKNVIRCAPLFHYKKKDLIVPVSNIYSWRIRREFRKINPDIVHVHHPFWLGSVGKKLATRYKKPVVFTYHTRLAHYNHYLPFFHKLGGGEIPHMLIKHFASACDSVIAPTTSAKKYLRNLGIGKLIVVQATGIDLNQPIHPPPTTMKQDGTANLFSVYRLSNEKNPYFMLEGLEKLTRESKVPFRCVIAGTGPEEEGMRNWIAERQLEDSIVLLGKIDPIQIPVYYKLADIFIFSSMSETQGMVILEAMAGATPVVAVDSSGISDIVENGVNGFKTKADLNEWTDKIKLLLEDKNLRQTMGETALHTAAHNSLEVMCENILDMYYEIIDWKEKNPDKVFIR